ncbi:MAG: 3-isopropylmalate dehydrogenase [Anaerolineales bacterium]|nr:3-isopropylmalate dehydrogenase [Anaerolineales bacterium]
MKANLVLLPGDGIGPEIVYATAEVMQKLAGIYGHEMQMQEYHIGGVAMDKCGVPLPEDTLQACYEADAILLGAVGGPKWDDPNAALRPEQGLLTLRKALELFGNLRPVKVYPFLVDASPLRPELLAGVDLLVVRELTGGLYFGQPKGRRIENGEEQAIDSLTYTESEIERVTRLAFELAGKRKRKVTSVDKANVLESSRLWRQTVTRVAKDYPDISLEHILVDAAAMYLITRPSMFDVILTENMFGDILTDESSVLAGSMGILPSSSLGDHSNSLGKLQGLYEPIHGSAPDIAGKGIANPVGTLLSASLLLRYSLGLETEAVVLEQAVERTLSGGKRTPDLGGDCNTHQFTQEVMKNLVEVKT